MGDHVNMFDVGGLYRALDAQRSQRELSWPGVAREMWEMSAELNQIRDEDRPIAAGTLTNVAKRGDTSFEHALFILRWLGRDPEDFIDGAPATTRAPLPPAGPDRRLRWHLHATPRRDLPGLLRRSTSTGENTNSLGPRSPGSSTAEPASSRGCAPPATR